MPLNDHQKQAATKVVALEQTLSPVDWEALELEDGALRTHLASQESPIEVEGTVSVDNLNGLTDAELRATPVETVETEAGTSATTVVSVTDSGVTVLAANADRLGGLISNPGATDVYISFGTNPATTSMHRLSEKGVIPIGRYTGAIYGITASGSQGVAVTEFEA